jgi:hypothetical protein
VDRDWIECKDRQLCLEIGQRRVKNLLCRQHYLVAGHTKRRCPQKYTFIMVRPQKYTFIMVHMNRKGFKWISWYTKCMHCSTNNFIWLRPPTHPLQMKVWKTEYRCIINQTPPKNIGFRTMYSPYACYDKGSIYESLSFQNHRHLIYTKRRRCPQKYTFIMVHMYRKGFNWISWYTRCIHCSTNNK